ncbi:MAG: ATP-binding protein [Acidimicrobiia bacterium]|nr:ATP-binding protein [Acidimicrobiia bacterium]
MSAYFCVEVGSAENESVDDALRHMEQSIEEFGRQEQWPDDLIFKLHLILEELGLNAMTYGGASSVRIVISEDVDEVTIEISDDGGAFDPLNEAPQPDVNAALEERSIGGLGIHLVRTLTNDLSYRREGGRNHLTLVTRRPE